MDCRSLHTVSYYIEPVSYIELVISTIWSQLAQYMQAIIELISYCYRGGTVDWGACSGASFSRQWRNCLAL